MLTSKIKRQIIEQAIAQPNQEICGVVLDNGDIQPMDNCAQDIQHNFSFNADEFNKIADSVVAIYHTHCLDSQPSQLSAVDIANSRSEERRVGKECRIGCRSRWSPYH